MPTLTACPSCAKQLKVPDELLGRQVKCPSCGTEFTATAAGAAPPPPQLAASAPAPYGDPRDIYGGEPTPGRSVSSPRLKGPGIGLLISSIIGLLIWGYQGFGSVHAIMDPDAAVNESVDTMVQLFELMGKKTTEKEKEDMLKQQKEQMTVVGPIQLVYSIVALVLSVVAIFGSIRMMRGQGGGLAWTAAAINVVPCTNLCCCAGIPIGIWAMMALHKAGQG